MSQPEVVQQGCCRRWLPWCGKRRRLTVSDPEASTSAPSTVHAPLAVSAYHGTPKKSAPMRLVDLNTAPLEVLSNVPSLTATLASQVLALREGGPITRLQEVGNALKLSKSKLVKLARHAFVHPELGLRVDARRSSAEDEDADLRRSAHRILVGAWNVRNLGIKSLTTRGRDIADIIAEYDVIALLELRDQKVVHGLLDILGTSRWGASLSHEVGHGKHKEVYAFLYRKASVTLKKHQLLADPGDKWVREPFLGYFKAPGGFDFVLAAVHVVWGEKIADRRKEVEAIGEKLEKVQNLFLSGERDVILVGDFNLDPKDKAWNGMKKAGWVPLLETSRGDTSMVMGKNLYDNIWLHDRHTARSEWLGAAGVMRFDNYLDFGAKAGSLKAKQTACKEMSDHRPTWAYFAADHDDDWSYGFIPLMS